MYKYYKPDFTIISTMIRNNYSIIYLIFLLIILSSI